MAMNDELNPDKNNPEQEVPIELNTRVYSDQFIHIVLGSNLMQVTCWHRSWLLCPVANNTRQSHRDWIHQI